MKSIESLVSLSAKVDFECRVSSAYKGWEEIKGIILYYEYKVWLLHVLLLSKWLIQAVCNLKTSKDIKGFVLFVWKRFWW